MATRDPSRGCRGRPSPNVSRRVRLSLQSPPLRVSGASVLSSSRTSGARGASVVSVPRRQPAAEAYRCPATKNAPLTPVVNWWCVPCASVARPQPVVVTALRWIPPSLKYLAMQNKGIGGGKRPLQKPPSGLRAWPQSGGMAMAAAISGSRSARRAAISTRAVTDSIPVLAITAARWTSTVRLLIPS